MSTASSARPPQPEIEYPDSDGEPLAENTLQYEWITTIVGGLESLFRDDPDVFVAGDLFWYAVEGDPTARTAPDALVVFGRPKGHRGSYMQWREGGIAPQVVFEILSPGNRAGEMARKLQFYDRHGTEEYYLYDPDRGLLTGYLRGPAGLAPIPEMNGWGSPRLGIRFQMWAGALTITGPDGRRFQTFVEIDREREEHSRRADEAQERAERMAAKLRAMGIDPDEG